jgi:hypothetical protein
VKVQLSTAFPRGFNLNWIRREAHVTKTIQQCIDILSPVLEPRVWVLEEILECKRALPECGSDEFNTALFDFINFKLEADQRQKSVQEAGLHLLSNGRADAVLNALLVYLSDLEHSSERAWESYVANHVLHDPFATEPTSFTILYHQKQAWARDMILWLCALNLKHPLPKVAGVSWDNLPAAVMACENPETETSSRHALAAVWHLIRSSLFTQRDQPKSHTLSQPYNGEWSQPNTLAYWARRFNVVENTIAAHFKNGIVTAKKVGKFWAVAVGEVPPEHN